MKACVNGRMVDESEASVSILDYGLLYGYGLFESMHAVKGAVFRLEKHLDRLRNSAELIGIPFPWSEGEISGMIQSTLRENRLKDAYVRLTLTRGSGEPRLTFSEDMKPNIIILARTLPFGIKKKQSEGIKLAVSKKYQVYSKDVRSRIKSTNYLQSALAKQEANEIGVDDVILRNENGFITECSTANIFLVSGKRLLTPPIESGILPGVMREDVIEIAKKLGTRVEENDISERELYSADEIFKTSSIMGIVPAVEVDGKIVGGGKPGEVTRRLQKEYEQLLKRTS